MTKELLNKPLIHIALLAAVAGYLFFFHLGAFALTDPDETFYGQTAKEMAARGEWMTPYIHGKPQFEKPVFFYWLTIISFKAFGVNEFAARFPSAVFGIIGVIAVYLLGRLLYGARAGLLSGCILAANVEYLMLARACVTDMVLSVFVLLGLLFFYHAHLKGKTSSYYLAAVMLALATLTKGPVGIVIPAVIIVTHLLLTRDFSFFKRVGVIVWIKVIFIAVAVPWYIAMYRLHGNAFIDDFFGLRNITRFLSPEHKLGSQWWYYIPVIFGGFFPWSAFLPVALWRGLRARAGSDILLLVWCAAFIGVFSVSGTKLSTYVLPCFPALALLVGKMWDGYLSGVAGRRGDTRAERGMAFSFYLLFAIVLFGSAGLCIYLSRGRYAELLPDTIVAASFVVAGFVLSLIAFRAKNRVATFVFIVYAVIVFMVPFEKLLMADLERFESSKELAMKMESLAKPGERFGAEKDYLSGLAFYASRPVEFIGNHHLITQFIASKERVWGLLKEKNHKQLYELDDIPYCYTPSYMVYKSGKKCVITNAVPESGKYLVRRGRER